MNDDSAFTVGAVQIIPRQVDVRELEADAFVQSSGTQLSQEIHLSRWVVEDEQLPDIEKALVRHSPFRLGDVIVTGAGSLPARYLFSAVVIDWGKQHPSGELINDDVVRATAQRCIAIAASLGLRSIVFLPWGTRVGAAEASHVTALMVQAITDALHEETGDLERVYLVSRNPEHFRWFVDRAFLFQIMARQIEELRNELAGLDLAADTQQRISEALGNLSQTVYVVNELVAGDKYSTGDISGSSGFAFGQGGSVDIESGGDS